MANPSSTSSKRLVGLGLRGMRNSVQAPPTQVTAQIKSALAQSSPRTSPTVNFTSSPTGATTTTTTTPTGTTPANASTPGGLTRTATTSPSGVSMRTSPSMMTITSFNNHHQLQHNGILGGGGGATTTAVMMTTRTLTSPTIGLKTALGGGAGGGVRGSVNPGVNNTTTTTSPKMLSRTGTTVTSPFGTPSSTPFVTPNTSPQMLASAGRVGSVVVEGGGGNSVPKVELGARGMKSPLHHRHGDFGHTVNDGYFGPMRRLEEIVNEISEEMREGRGSGARNGEGEGGDSPQTEPSEVSPKEPPMFYDVPFPLRPDKTFRIHSSPTTVNEWGVTKGNGDGDDSSSRFKDAPTTTPQRNQVSPATGDMSSTGNTSNHDSFIERFIINSSSSIASPGSPSSTRSGKQRKLRFSPLPSPSSPRLPPESPSSSGSKYSRISGDGGGGDYTKSFSSTSSPLATKSKPNLLEGRQQQWVSSPPPSPSSTLSRWLREGENNSYSTMRSPILVGESHQSSGRRRVRLMSGADSDFEGGSPREGGGLMSCSSSVGSSVGSRRRSGFNSPVAKIETVLGPRERGIGCIPEKRDYQSLYSRFRSPSMSPGSLAPLEEDESVDFDFGDGDGDLETDDIDSPLSSHFNNNIPAPSPIIPSSPSPGGLSSLPGSASQIPGMPVVTSSDNTVVVANAAVGILSGVGTGGGNIGAGAGGGPMVLSGVTATSPAPRLGLRRKSTGVGSPLVNVVATYDSIKSEQQEAKVEEGKGAKGIEGKRENMVADEGDTPMSPVLMKTKDSLLLKDGQRQKTRRRNTMNDSVMENSEFLMDREMKNRQELRSRGLEMRPVSPPLWYSPPESIRAADILTERSTQLPRWSPTQALLVPDTPTIEPCAMTVEGSKPVDEAISPLQLSSPILPSVACS